MTILFTLPKPRRRSPAAKPRPRTRPRSVAGRRPPRPGKRRPGKNFFHTPAGRRTLLALILVVLVAAMAGVSWWRYNGKNKEPSQPDEVLGVPVHTDYLPEGIEGRPGIQRQVKWVVIHETGNPAAGSNAAAHNTYIHKKAQTDSLSWHYTVDESEIYHHLPDNEVAWHAGDKLTKNGGNLNGIGIEICINEDGNYDQAVDNAAKLTAYLLHYYKLGTDHIKQHGDFISKNCPEIMRNAGAFPAFVQKVQGYLDQM